MQFRLSAFVTRREKVHGLTVISGGAGLDWSIHSRDPAKLRTQAVERLRKELPKLERSFLPRVQAVQGRRLERVQLDFNVYDEDGKRKNVTGFFPLVTEPRLTAPDRWITIAYHPLRAADWFEVNPDGSLGEQAARVFAHVFAGVSDFDSLKSAAEDKLVTLSFNADPPSLFDLLKKADDRRVSSDVGKSDLWTLLRTATNVTARAAEGRLDAGMPRPTVRERLASLLCGEHKTPVLVIGPPGSGKSTLIAGLVHDLLAAENFASHRNLDRVHNVWRLQGRHIIAGMSYVGQWEARCVALLERAKKHRMMFWVDDLHAWPRIGRSTSSDRSLTDFFRAPLARRSVCLVAECTAEQLAVLERDAPAFTTAFARVYLEPSSAAETLGMMLHEGRELESDLGIAIDPRCFSRVRDLSASLFSASAFPGKALEPLKAVCSERAARPAREDEPERTVTPEDVVAWFSRQTGLPEVLLTAERPLHRADLYRELERQIVGQRTAVDAACDLILGVRAGLSAHGRPYGVFLFTGPTGTGKTELAKCIAEYLYGDVARLVRFDMGELNTPLALERLIGSSVEPEGQLTRAVRAQPFSVLLFDEIEKAHPSVLNLLLQVLDDGRLTDAGGSVADFTHTVVIMTSNLGAGEKRVSGFVEDGAAVSADIARAIREFFPPELFNRIDRVVPFQPLTREHAELIVQKELAKLAARPGLGERNIFLRFSEAVVRRVVERGYRAEYGARALKRFIDREVGDLVAGAVTREKSAEMRSFHLHVTGDGRFAIHAESLREHEPVANPAAIEELLAERGQALLARVPEALAFLGSNATAQHLESFGHELSEALRLFRAGERERASEIFSFDDLRTHVQGLLGRLEHLLVPAAELEARTFDGERDRRQPPSPRDLLTDLVEARFLERALAGALDLDEHAVLIELLRLGELNERRRFSGGASGLLEWLVPAYAGARGVLERAAVAFHDGRIEQASSLAKLEELLQERPRAVALLQLGPSLKRYFAGEAGCHVRRTAASGPEIVRVRLLSAADPNEHLARHQELCKRFERALETNSDLPENPERLLPVVRSLRFDPEPGKLTPATVLDYRLAHVSERRVRSLADLLRDIWLLNAGAAAS